MSGQRTTIYVGEGLRRALDARTAKGGRGASTAINAMATRYDEICREGVRELAWRVSEWQLVVEALRPACDDAKFKPNQIYAAVEEAINVFDAAAGKNIDGDWLLEDLASMDRIALTGLLDLADRYWTTHRSIDGLTKHRIRAMGGKVLPVGDDAQ